MRRVVAAGVVVGVLAALAVARLGGTRDTTPPADAFLTAWRRSLTATYAMTDHVERVLVSGRRYSSDVRVVQRPPDRIREGGGGTEGRVGGRRFGCVIDGGCRLGGPAPPYEKEVDDEVDLLRAMVKSRTPLYRVEKQGNDCFLLVLQARILAPPYGEDATFCFDPQIGAPRRSVVHRAEATDTHVTVDLRVRVTDADLQLPPELRRPAGT